MLDINGEALYNQSGEVDSEPIENIFEIGDIVGLQFQERFWLFWNSTNEIKIGKRFSRNLQRNSLQILAEMVAGKTAGSRRLPKVDMG